jgi:hypothetical protein
MIRVIDWGASKAIERFYQGVHLLPEHTAVALPLFPGCAQADGLVGSVAVRRARRPLHVQPIVAAMETIAAHCDSC